MCEVIQIQPDPFTDYRVFDPDLVAEYLDFEKSLFTDAELPAKTKYLIAVALAAFNRSQTGSRRFRQDALKAGATWGEIKEALRVAYHIGHATPFWTVVYSLQK